MIHLEISNLFFNHPHSHRDKIHKELSNRGSHPDRWDLELAASADAKEFCAQYPDVTRFFGVTPEELAHDYNMRK